MSFKTTFQRRDVVRKKFVNSKGTALTVYFDHLDASSSASSATVMKYYDNTSV
jgi:hypothetical protein